MLKERQGQEQEGKQGGQRHSYESRRIPHFSYESRRTPHFSYESRGQVQEQEGKQGGQRQGGMLWMGRLIIDY